MTTAMWVFVLAIAIPVLVQFLKRYAAVIEGNKTLTRLIVIAVAVGGAIVVQLTTVGAINWDVVFTAAALTVGGSEITYQWIIKYLQSLGGERV